MDLIDDSEATAQVVSEINRYAARADVNFSGATLQVLEQQAFELALARRDADDLDEFKTLFLLIQKAKTTSVRERMAKVQERKCDLRQEEVELKKTKEAHMAAAANSKSQTKPASSHPLKSLEGIPTHEIFAYFPPKLPPAPTPQTTARAAEKSASNQPAFNNEKNSTTQNL